MMLRRDCRLRRLSLILLPALVFLAGCATPKEKIETGFGAETDVAGIIITSTRLEEGVVRITATVAAGDIPVTGTSVRLARNPEVGFDYGAPEGRNPNVDGHFSYDGYYGAARKDLHPGEAMVVDIVLENMMEVNRSFRTTVVVGMKDELARRELRIEVEDEDWFSDAAFLRSLNCTDYWHPRIYYENMEKYYSHIGQVPPDWRRD